MRKHEALASALGILSSPYMARQARGLPLPDGMTFLLEVAAGETEASSEAAALTGKSKAILFEAAGFFIEQVLLDRQADKYRILGSCADASSAELRRHMALLMRWLHPDAILGDPSAQSFDRSIYVSRVTQAWEAVKTDERRTAYDTSLSKVRLDHAVRKTAERPKLKFALPVNKGRRRMRLVRQPQRENPWKWLLLFFGLRRQ